MTNLAVERNGRIIRELCVPTTIPALRAALQAIPRPRKMTFEEGPMAQWLADGLRPVLDELLICDPRRNGLISKDGDADDAIDARKLAALLRGGFLRAVYHSDDDRRVELKQWVGLYHDRVRDAVRQVNKIRGHSWQHGLRPARGALRNVPRRKAWLTQLAWQVNRHLKNAVMGTALSAVQQGDNGFARQYERLVHNGLSSGNARHTVARKILTVMWGMWKTSSPFDPSRV